MDDTTATSAIDGATSTPIGPQSRCSASATPAAPLPPAGDVPTAAPSARANITGSSSTGTTPSVDSPAPGLRMLRRLGVALTACALPLASGSVAAADPALSTRTAAADAGRTEPVPDLAAPAGNKPHPAFSDPGNASRARAVTEALATIESVPSTVLNQGDAATREWINDNSQITSPRANVATCATGLALFLGTEPTGAEEIRRLQHLLHRAGGVDIAVEVMWGSGFSYQQIQAFGGPTADLVRELHRAAPVRDQCFV